MIRRNEERKRGGSTCNTRSKSLSNRFCFSGNSGSKEALRRGINKLTSFKHREAKADQELGSREGINREANPSFWLWCSSTWQVALLPLLAPIGMCVSWITGRWLEEGPDQYSMREQTLSSSLTPTKMSLISAGNLEAQVKYSLRIFRRISALLTTQNDSPLTYNRGLSADKS